MAQFKKKTYKKVSIRSTAIKNGYKSGLEDVVAHQIKSKGLEVNYEIEKIKYVVPLSNHTYTPDFKLPNGIFVETKGRFMPEDRKKQLLVQFQRPDLDIRFVFSSSNAKITKGSKTTYGDWCNKNGFKYADKLIPESWFHEQEK